MSEKPNPTWIDDDAPEWSEADFKNASMDKAIR